MNPEKCPSCTPFALSLFPADRRTNAVTSLARSRHKEGAMEIVDTLVPSFGVHLHTLAFILGSLSAGRRLTRLPKGLSLSGKLYRFWQYGRGLPGGIRTILLWPGVEGRCCSVNTVRSQIDSVRFRFAVFSQNNVAYHVQLGLSIVCSYAQHKCYQHLRTSVHSFHIYYSSLIEESQFVLWFGGACSEKKTCQIIELIFVCTFWGGVRNKLDYLFRI